MKEKDYGSATHQPNSGRIGTKPPAAARNRLRQLSELDLVRFTAGGEVLLPGHVSPDLDNERARPNRELRRGDAPRNLTEAEERALWRQLPQLVERFSAHAGGDGAKREIRDMLPRQIEDRLRREKDDAERRRLLLMFSANLVAPERAPTSIDDARNLLARTPSPDALQAAIKAAQEQHKPAPTPPPAPGARPRAPGMNV